MGGAIPGMVDMVAGTAAIAVSRNVALVRCAQSSSPEMGTDPPRATEADAGLHQQIYAYLSSANTHLSTNLVRQHRCVSPAGEWPGRSKAFDRERAFVVRMRRLPDRCRKLKG
jgi:hypothetical protein